MWSYLSERKCAITFERPPEERNLSMHFISSLKNNNLFEILEDRVVKEGSKEQLEEVAELAKRCLRMNGEGSGNGPREA